MGGVTQVGGDDVDVALASGPAHGHVGQLSSAAVFQGVGDVHGLALGPVGGDGVGVGELVGAESSGPMRSSAPSGVTASNEPAAGSTEVTTARCEVTQAPSRPGGKRDDPVAGPVAPASGASSSGPERCPAPPTPGGRHGSELSTASRW